MKTFLVLFTATIAGWGPCAWAQSLRARELFYTPPPAPGAASQAAPSSAAPASAPVPATNTAVVAGTKQVTKKGSAPAAGSGSAPAQPSSAGSSLKGTSSGASVQNVSVHSPARNEVPVQNVKNASETVPLGMRYAVLKRGADGKFAEVDPEATFHAGDRIRLEVQANSTGYLYVVAQGSSGAWQVLFPARQVDNGSNIVHRGETRQVPGGGAGQFFFDEQAGAEKLFFILTRQPEQNIDRLIYSMGGQSAPADSGKPAEPSKSDPPRMLMAQATIGDDVISEIRGQMVSRDLIFEKVEGARVQAQAGSNGEAKYETAAYVVNPSTAPDARLVVDVKLTHQ